MPHSDVREVGAEWLAYQALDQLKMKEFLENVGFSELEIQLACTYIKSRAVCPNSEYATARWIKENSAVSELTHYPLDMLTKDKLYNCNKQLYTIKDKKVTQIYRALNYKPKPFKQKNFVVPPQPPNDLISQHLPKIS